MNPKRIYRILIPLSLLLLVFSSMNAQIRLAAIVGIQSSNLTEKNSIPGFDTASGKYYSSNTGFELGVLAEIPLGKYNLFLQPGILYSSKGNQYQRVYDSSAVADTQYAQHTLNLNYVEMPVYLTWKLNLSKDQKNHFYISAGPYFAFIYSVSQSYQNRILQYNSTTYTYSSGSQDVPVGNGQGAYKTFDIGIGARAGFELGGVSIGAYYSSGFTNIYTAAYPSTFHNNVIGGSIGIWLNKAKPPVKPVMDTDHDGTPDPEDSCVTIPGSPKYHGCPIPDTDHDGVNDEEDSCKTVPGPARYHGCPIPDTDQDGINDEEDSCKTVPGVKKYHGCPIPDRDHDGVNDEIDRCPDEPGPADNQGCPVIKTAVVQRAQLVAADVIFKVNSTKLTRNSYPALKEIADSLTAHSDLDLLIEGHTDNTGKPAYNMKLSTERAEAVRKILLADGIPGNRVAVKGFGDTKPVADNDTLEGKTKNRRVVFVFQLKNR
jgi:OmpA-OmpF porin, OOP family